MKLLIVGLDGCTDRAYWDRELEMPFIKKKLIPKSYCGTSISFVQENREGRVDPHTGPNWSSIYTGVAPEIHGVDYGGWMFDHKSHGSLKVKSIWYMIREEYSLGLIGMPVTYPAFKCNWMLSGFPNSEVTPMSVYPKHIYEGLAKSQFMVDYGDGKTLWRDRLYNSWKGGENEKFVSIEFEKIELAKKLHATDPVDVLAFGITSLDKSSHIFTMFSRQTMYVYRKVDKVVRLLVEHFDPENIIIVSDHGFQAVEGRHNEFGFFLWYKKGFNEQDALIETIPITDTTKIILDCLEMSHNQIGVEVPVDEFKQERDEAIEHRFRQLGYIK